MSKKTLLAKIEELKELEAQKKALDANINTIKAEIQKDMDKKNVEEMNIGEHIVRWTKYISNKFDSKAFKANHKRLHSQYLVETEARRFTVV